jgi:hypothetical protein
VVVAKARTSANATRACLDAGRPLHQGVEALGRGPLRYVAEDFRSGLTLMQENAAVL